MIPWSGIGPVDPTLRQLFVPPTITPSRLDPSRCFRKLRMESLADLALYGPQPSGPYPYPRPPDVFALAIVVAPPTTLGPSQRQPERPGSGAFSMKSLAGRV